MLLNETLASSMLGQPAIITLINAAYFDILLNYVNSSKNGLICQIKLTTKPFNQNVKKG